MKLTGVVVKKLFNQTTFSAVFERDKSKKYCQSGLFEGNFRAKEEPAREG